jgi:hypothetical protein
VSSRPLVSWKHEPPATPAEAAAASLLRALGPAPALVPESIERIAHRAHLSDRAQRVRTALRRRARLAFEARLAALAAAVAMAGILAALVWRVLDLTAR